MLPYGKNSPYAQTPMVNSHLDLLVYINIPAQHDDVQFTITSLYTHRPDLLAYDIYGDAGLWWVFAVRNQNVIKDSIYDFVPGQRIFLPKLTTIKSVIGS